MKRILVVDDDELLGRIYCEILESEGHEVIFKKSGEKALEFLNDTKVIFDLILVDYAMPKMTGSDFVKRLQEGPRGIHSNTPIVGFSFYPVEDTRIEKFTERLTGFFEKPSSADEFLHIIREFTSDSATLQ